MRPLRSHGLPTVRVRLRWRLCVAMAPRLHMPITARRWPWRLLGIGRGSGARPGLLTTRDTGLGAGFPTYANLAGSSFAARWWPGWRA